jgi:protein-L-isoaspartate(D-aspartate) O-methyltransferase
MVDRPYTEEEKTAFAQERERMVVRQIARRGVKNPTVLTAFRKTPRHLFVPDEHRKQAYNDWPLPIGYGQTISQPYIVALMTQHADIQPEEKVLEIGTGSGYQTAILANLAKEVYTIEIVDHLCERARSDLRRAGYQNVHVRCGDGYVGWPGQAPFDAVIVTAAPPKIPQPLIDQLKPGGRLIAPVGASDQQLVELRKDERGQITERVIEYVRFVPMTGKAQEHQ